MNDKKLSPEKLAENKQKALEAALKQAKEQFGAGTIMYLTDGVVDQVPVISTGSISLDKATGIGGIPLGRITEIFGHTGSGKTTLALNLIREAQKKGMKTVFIDAEHTMNREYAIKIGINLSQLLFNQPQNAEQAFDLISLLVKSSAIDLIIVDSIPALISQIETDLKMDEVTMAAQARLLSTALRRLVGSISYSNTAVVFINQLRTSFGPHGPQDKTPGGMALPFYCSLRLSVNRIGSIKKADDIIGHNMKINVVKNKFAPPHQSAECELIYGEGINIWKEIMEDALERGTITKSGSWYSIGDKTIAQGMDSLIKIMKEDRNLLQQVSNYSHLVV